MMFAMMHFLVEDFSLDMPERVVVDASLPDPWNSKILISSFTIQLVGYASRTVQFQDPHNYFLVVYKRCSYYFITAEIFKFLSSSISLLLFFVSAIFLYFYSTEFLTSQLIFYLLLIRFSSCSRKRRQGTNC